MKRISLILTILFVISLMAGCKKAIVPFKTNPEGAFKDAAVESDIAKADELRDIYEDYFTYRVLGQMPDPLEKKIDAMSEEEAQEFSRRAAIIGLFELTYSKDTTSLEGFFLKRIKSYLNDSKMGKEADGLTFSDELKAFDPINKVQQYMKDNKIKVTELVLPDTFVETDCYNYPISLKYKYIVKGTVNEKEFEKEITQTFFFEFTMDDGNIENTQEYLSYIK
jgi:hypothetical protein